MPLIRNFKNGRWIDYQHDPMPTLSAAEIQAKLYSYAEQYSIERYPSEHRHHLGISVIGDDCSRKLWYGFRWVKLGQAEGRMRRLWARGHREEAQFEAFLMWAGFSTRTIDPKTDREYKISLLNGHYGGTPDRITLVRWLDDLPVLCEFKTHNNKSFTELKEKKVKLAKPLHWKQMCGYGKELEFKYALYCAVNKDTDEWHFEFLELDWNVAIELEKKAADIIYSQTPPPKINENPSYWKCKWCTDFNGICHQGEIPEKNCRSCANASPGQNGEWDCKIYGQIPRDFLKQGCPEWERIV